MKALATFRGGTLIIQLTPETRNEKDNLHHWEGKAMQTDVHLYPLPYPGSSLKQLQFVFTPGRKYVHDGS